MVKEIVFWYQRKKDESCSHLFNEFILPHLGEHQILKKIQELPLRCEFFIQNNPIVLKEKKNDLKINENDPGFE